MNIDDMTIKEFKELRSLLENSNQDNKSSLYDRYIGKYVICRTRNEGVNAGYVIAADETGVILKDARRLYYHKPKSSKLSWYEGVAQDGLSDDSKVGVPREKLIAEDYSLTLCDSAAEISIVGAKNHGEN